MLAIPFPAIDPVLLQLGPFAIRWYALAYIGALLLGWRYSLFLARRVPHFISAKEIDDLLVWATLGVVFGGRIGYVLFYKPGYYIEHPLEAAALWHGGMSFHGGAIGVITALVLFARTRGLSFVRLGDLVVTAIPIDLFFGRLANFINGELYGRPTEMSWGMVFPTDPQQLVRHPSQLYQASLEGVILFLILFVAEMRFGVRRWVGLQSGLFLSGYAIVRSIGELFRQPDEQLGFLIFGATMGQLLSLPMLIVGIYFILQARRRPVPAIVPAAASQ